MVMRPLTFLILLFATLSASAIAADGMKTAGRATFAPRRRRIGDFASVVKPLPLLAETSPATAPAATARGRALRSVPRGGAGPLDPSVVAKSATAFLAIYGAACLLFPQKIGEAYGLEGIGTPATDFAGKNAGVAIVSTTIAAACRLFGGTDVKTAVGWSALPRAISCAHSILSDKPGELDFRYAAEFVSFSLYAACAIAALVADDDDTILADAAVLVLAGWTIVHGLLLAIKPKMFGRLWAGLGLEDDDTLAYSWRTVGYDLLWLGVLLLSLGLGASDHRAVGYSWIVGLAYLLSVLFVTGEVEEFDMPRGPMYAWMVIVAVVIGTLAF